MKCKLLTIQQVYCIDVLLGHENSEHGTPTHQRFFKVPQFVKPFHRPPIPCSCRPTLSYYSGLLELLAINGTFSHSVSSQPVWTLRPLRLYRPDMHATWTVRHLVSSPCGHLDVLSSPCETSGGE